MTLTNIKYFITTAECLSFSKAAEQLFITQPALSRQIISMEKELNVLLFIRHKNHTIELTPAGKILLDSFKSIYNEYTISVERAKKVAFSIHSELKIGILQGTSISSFMPNIVMEFKKNYPNIDLNMKYYSFGQLTSMLYKKELDLIITLYFSIENLENLSFKIIDRASDCFVMSKQYAQSVLNGNDFSVSFLDKKQLIVLSKEDNALSASLILKELHKKDIYPNIIYVDDVDTLKLWVEAGYGVAVVDSFSDLTFNSNFVTYPFHGSWDPSLTIAWNQENAKSGISIFLDCLRHTKIRS